jgi:ADP-ribosyl-[dinitrogen reductase] hydrolase
MRRDMLELRERSPAAYSRAERFRGCLLAGAAGDALGAPVEFLSLAEIRERYGPAGIRDYDEAYGRIGAITDDTQMTLFTAEGLLRAMVRMKDGGTGGAHVALVKRAYMRWLETQKVPLPAAYRAQRDAERERGWLIGQPELHSRRAPGNTCLSALQQTPLEALRASNGSKGCGGLMRVAPAAMFSLLQGSEEANEGDAGAHQLGCELAAITHGHPTGQHASGALVAMLVAALEGAPLHDALARALSVLRRFPEGEETRAALIEASNLAQAGVPAEVAIARLGEGWVAEEALAIGLYCALTAKDLASGVRTAVNIDGDSDSTGAIAGNLLGAVHGETAIPLEWLENLELREVIAQVADDFQWIREADFEDAEQKRYWWDRYPGV